MTEPKKKPGNPAWHKGMKSANPEGRPKVLDKDKKTNKARRNKEFMDLVRKLKPKEKKAVEVFDKILSDPDASYTHKLQAAKFILEFKNKTVESLYDLRYDNEEGEAIQEDNKPKFSLSIVKEEK